GQLVGVEGPFGLPGRPDEFFGEGPGNEKGGGAQGQAVEKATAREQGAGEHDVSPIGIAECPSWLFPRFVKPQSGRNVAGWKGTKGMSPLLSVLEAGRQRVGSLAGGGPLDAADHQHLETRALHRLDVVAQDVIADAPFA